MHDLEAEYLNEYEAESLLRNFTRDWLQRADFYDVMKLIYAVVHDDTQNGRNLGLRLFTGSCSCSCSCTADVQRLVSEEILQAGTRGTPEYKEAVDDVLELAEQLDSVIEVNQRSGLPKGVTKDRNRFKAQIRENGKKKHIGSYSTPEAAHQAYLKAKAQRCEQKHLEREQRREHYCDLPKGVTMKGNKFKAQIAVDGKMKYLGLFDTPEQASQAYLKAKEENNK